MEFIVSRNNLMKALRHVQPAVRKSKELPILRYVMFSFPDDAKRNVMTIHAYNGEVWISETIPLDAPAVQARPVYVYHSDIINLIKSLDEQPLHFTVFEYQLKVVHSCGSFRLPLNCCNVFPAMCPCPDVEAPDGYSFDYEAPGLRSVLSKCAFAMSKSEFRPTMMAVCMNLTEEYADFVSSDGHKLVRVRKKPVYFSDCKLVSTQLIIPSDVVRMLLKILPPTGDIIFAFQKESEERSPSALITIDDTIKISFRPIEGRYPNYLGVIPEYGVFKVTVDRKLLMKSVNRLGYFSTDKGLVRIDLSSESLSLRVRDVDYDGDEVVACSVKKMDGTSLSPGCFLSVGLKASTLVDILKVINTAEVTLQFIDSTHCVLIFPQTQSDIEDITILMMPILLSD